MGDRAWACLIWTTGARLWEVSTGDRQGAVRVRWRSVCSLVFFYKWLAPCTKPCDVAGDKGIVAWAATVCKQRLWFSPASKIVSSSQFLDSAPCRPHQVGSVQPENIFPQTMTFTLACDREPESQKNLRGRTLRRL